ncbi:MAG: helix-turn-helix transcriptional regulator [Micrococcales bacterium]
MALKIDLSERLFNLTCALLLSERGLTKQEIFNTVQGYKEQYTPRGDQNAIDRLFDRDKNLLLSNGVNLVSYIPPDAMEDNSEYRYYIPRESVTWPAGFKFTRRQMALLNLASQMWAKASMSSETARGVVRLRALGELPEASNLLGVAPLILTKDRTFSPLNDAIDRGDVVKFDYRKAANDEIETRTVQPWSLQLIAGNWLLVCWDEDKQEVRNFLLKRIISRISLVNRRFTKPKQSQLDAALEDLQELSLRQVATLKVTPESAAWFHFELHERDGQEIELNYTDLHLLADDLREFAFDIEVLRPAELREAIAKGFERVANAHHA